MNAPPTPAPGLRPLAIGELVDRSASVWRQHFGTLFRLYLVFNLGVFILTRLYELGLAHFVPLARGGAKLMQAAQEDAPMALRQSGLGLVLLLVFALLSTFLGWNAAVIGSHYVIRRQLGEPATLREGVARARARFGTLCGAYALATIWGGLVALLSLCPGIVLVVIAFQPTLLADPNLSLALAGLGMVVGGLGLLVTFLWYVLRFLLTSQVIALEDVSAFGALRRSGELVSGRIGQGLLNRVKVRATVLLTLVFAILLVVGMIAGAPSAIVSFLYANPLDPMHADPDAIPQLLLVPAQLFEVLAEAAVAPLYLVVGALFYVDMRVRREGLDLELQLAASGR